MANIEGRGNIMNNDKTTNVKQSIENRSNKKEAKSKPQIIGVGEILWDMLPGGRKLGGAPTNFAYHASRLGGDAYIVSSVGDDYLGKTIINRVNELGLSSQYIQVDANHPTGTVDVALGNKGIPSYKINREVAWDYIKETDDCIELAKRADVICFGSLGQRSKSSRDTILRMLDNSRKVNNLNSLKVFDVNLRQDFYNTEILHNSLEYANILKLNDEELPIIAKLLGLNNSTKKLFLQNENEYPYSADLNMNYEIGVLNNLAKTYELDLIALTRGDRGSLLLYKGVISNHLGYKVEIVDTVGAGDSFTAAVVMGLIKGLKLNEVNDLANRIASYVCTQEGGTPILPEELTNLSW